MPGQVYISDQLQRTSESELDLNGLMDESDQNSPCSDRDVHFKCTKSACSDRVFEQSDPNSYQVSQSDTNKQILAQLQSLVTD